MSTLRTVTAAGAAGAGLLAYSLVEARLPVLRRVTVPVLAPDEEPVTILHLSDLHLTDRTEARVAWVRSLARLRPDVVIDTGDNLSFASGLEPLGRALEPLLSLPGAFVLGDHDYRTTIFRSPTRYLRADPRTADRPGLRSQVAELPWRQLRDLLASRGWVELTNTRGVLVLPGRRISLVGVDDPHVEQDRYPDPVAGATPSPAGPREDQEGTVQVGHAVRDHHGRELLIGLTHAPYRRVLEAMVSDGVALALAGHTHGGQLCLPGAGALVTNCDLDRRRARGLSRYPGARREPGARGAAEREGMYLHVSAGLGTSPYTPVRLACRPEATLLRLVPAPTASSDGPARRTPPARPATE